MVRRVGWAVPAATLAVFFLSAVASAQAPPQLPHVFYGTVRFFNGAREADAPQGALLVASVDGVEGGRAALPRPGLLGDLRTRCGQFLCLLVQGNIPAGAAVRFSVNGIPSTETASFSSGEITELHWRIPDATPPSGPTGVAKATPPNDPRGAFTWSPAQDTASGVAWYVVRLDGGAPQDAGPATSWASPGPVSDGTHTFAVRAVDRVGNEGAEQSLEFLVDTTPPEPPAELRKTTPDNQPRPAFAWAPGRDAGSGLAGYALRIDEGPPITLAPVTSFTAPGPLPEGRHTLAIASRDAAGNESAPVSVTFLIDVTPPPQPRDLRKASPDNDERPSFAWSAVQDNLSGLRAYQVRLDQGEWLDVGPVTAWQAPAALAEGAHSLALRAEDAAGNLSVAVSLEFLVDRTAPTAPSGLKAVRTPDPNRPAFAWEGAQEALSGIKEYQVQLDNSGWQSAGLELSWTVPVFLSDGRHVVSVRAFDKAGNFGPAATIEFSVDTRPPRIGGIAIATAGAGAVRLSWSTDEPSRSHVEYGETESYGHTTTPGPALATSHSADIAGLSSLLTYHFRVRAVDAAGNEAVSEDRTFSVASGVQLEVSQLRVAPRSGAPGAEVTIRARVSNIGAREGLYSLPLVVNGRAVHVASGTLAAGQSADLSFALRAEQEGSYDVRWGGLAGGFSIAAPVVVARSPVALTVSADSAVATDARGRELKVVPGAVQIKREGGAIRLVLPVVAEAGTRVSSFLDRGSGLSLTEDRLVIPIRDTQGQVAIRIVAEVEAATGTGEAAEVKVRRMALEVLEHSVDLSAEEKDVGKASVGLRAELKDLPSEIGIKVAVAKLPPPDAVAAIQAAAEREGKALRDLAYSVTVEKQGLEDVRVLGQGVVTMKVGRAWADKHGAGNARVLRLSDAGELESLETRLLGLDQDAAVFEAASPRGLSVFSLVALQPLPPRFQVRALTARPAAVAPGRPVAVEALIANTGGQPGLYVATLRVGGVEQEPKGVVIEAQSSETLTFSVSRDKTGVYRVELAEASAEFAVVPARFVVSGLTVTPPQVLLGQEATVTVRVANEGLAPGSYEATLLLNGVTAGQQGVALDPGASQTLSFTVPASAPGRLTVQVGESRGELIVLRPASFAFSGLRVTPAQAEVGREVSVSVQVANEGDVEGSRDVALLLNGAVVGTGAVALKPGASQALTFALPAKEVGRFTVEIGGAKAELHVVAPASFTLSGLILSLPRVRAGERVTVTFRVTNSGGAQGTYLIVLLLDGNELDRRQVSLGPGADVVVEMALSTDSPGAHMVGVDGLSATFQVTARGGLPAGMIAAIGLAALLLAGLSGFVVWRRVRRRLIPGA